MYFEQLIKQQNKTLVSEIPDLWFDIDFYRKQRRWSACIISHENHRGNTPDIKR